MKVVGIILISLFVIYIGFGVFDIVRKAIKKRKNKMAINADSSADDKSIEEVEK